MEGGSTNADSTTQQQKPSRGFLWWGGFLVVSFIFGPGKVVFVSGVTSLIALCIVCLAISAGICYLWYWISGRRQKRSLIPRLVGTALFVFGSASPMLILEYAGLRMNRGVSDWFELPVASLLFLCIAYLLMFRRHRPSSQVPETDS